MGSAVRYGHRRLGDTILSGTTSGPSSTASPDKKDKPLLRRWTFYTIEVFFSRTLFLSGCVFGLVSLRRACYRLVFAFSIPLCFPLDKRRRSCSGNPGVRFLIKALNGRFR